MRRRLALALFAAVSLSLTACTATGGDAGPSASPSPTPSPTATAEPQQAAIVLTVDELQLVDETGATVSSASLDDGDLIGFLGDALGSLPDPQKDDRYGFVFYDWGTVRLGTSEGVAGGWVTVSAAGENELAFRTESGLTVGSTREEALAAGAVSDYVDPEGAYEVLRLDPREVPGTTSLERPGETGVEFVSLTIVDDQVAQISVPGNDYSDL